MKNEQKNCPFSEKTHIKKNGFRNHIQRYKCTSCNKTFTFQKKLNPSDIWKDYSQGKQTYKELSIKYQCSVKTIQRYIDPPLKQPLNSPISIYLNIIFLWPRIWLFSDGRRGLLKDLLNTPTQMCYFHLVAMVMRKLRKKHKSMAGKELKILVKKLKESRKNDLPLRNTLN